jgi:hypothetical protein
MIQQMHRAPQRLSVQSPLSEVVRERLQRAGIRRAKVLSDAFEKIPCLPSRSQPS